MNALLALLLALPVRAAVVAESARPVASIPALPASAISASVAAPALTAPTLISAPISSDRPAAPGAPLAAPIAATAAGTPAAAPAQAVAPRAGEAARLHAIFARLDAEFPLPAASPTAQVRARVRGQLLAASREYAEPEADILEIVAIESDRALSRIQVRLDAGDIDPSRTVRLSEDAPEIKDGAHAHIGVYPVAADPFQWGHLLIALRAVGELGVDKVVFVLAGDDPRKPTMTPVALRHPMGREVLDVFAPFFAYSPIAVGTTLDGETNIFRILALNPGRRVDAWYMVGDDHYRLVDKKGNPDTLPKLEANFAKPMGHSQTLHELKVAFIQREGQTEEIPSPFDVRFLDHVGFDASSTMVRSGGRHTLMPYAAYDYARRKSLYGLGDEEDASADPKKN
jgi:nicotinic acid mononucleotide adenylyltransferase